MGHALNRGTFFDARGFAAHVEKYRKRFFRRPINWAMEKSILAAHRSPLRKDVRKPAGFPTPFGVGLPGLILCRDCMRPHTECKLGKGFALPLAPNPVRQPAGFPTPFRGWASPVLFCAGVVCGRIPSANWGRALPFPLPLTQSGGLRPSRHLPRSFGG